MDSIPQIKLTLSGGDLARYWSKVNQTVDCWLWTASIGSHGYGQFWAVGRFWLAHRMALVIVGALQEELHVDHLCRIRKCVRPDHLECVTQAENNSRMGAALREIKTHCKHGHEFTEENTFRNSNGYRECYTCIKARTAAAWQRKKAMV